MYALTLSCHLKFIMACMTIEERGRAVGMVSAGSSLKQVIVLIENKEAYRLRKRVAFQTQRPFVFSVCDISKSLFGYYYAHIHTFETHTHTNKYTK